MIVALHGAVGSAKDWNHLSFTHHFLKAINLWRLLECCPKSLEEAGAAVNGEATDTSNILIGYSMGGRIALHALVSDSSKWEKAIIISAHTGLTNEVSKSERRISDAEWATRALQMHWDSFTKLWNDQSILPNCTVPNRQILKPWRKQIARSFIDWSTGSQKNLLPMLEQVNTPILWLTGEQDTKFSQVAKTACEILPNARHQAIKHCGHRVPWEQPEQCQTLISQFLME